MTAGRQPSAWVYLDAKKKMQAAELSFTNVQQLAEEETRPQMLSLPANHTNPYTIPSLKRGQFYLPPVHVFLGPTRLSPPP